MLTLFQENLDYKIKLKQK